MANNCQSCGSRKGCDCMESYLRLQKAFSGMAIVEKQSVAGAGASVMRVMCRNECLDGGCKSKFCRENGTFSHCGDWDFKDEEYKANILAEARAKVLSQNRIASEHRRSRSRERQGFGDKPRERSSERQGFGGKPRERSSERQGFGGTRRARSSERQGIGVKPRRALEDKR